MIAAALYIVATQFCSGNNPLIINAYKRPSALASQDASFAKTPLGVTYLRCIKSVKTGHVL